MSIEIKPQKIRSYRGWIYDAEIMHIGIDIAFFECHEYCPTKLAYFVFKKMSKEVMFCAFSQHVETLIGTRARSLLGLSIRDLYNNRPGLSEVLIACLENKKDKNWEGWYTFHSDGSTRYITAICKYIEPAIVVIEGEEKNYLNLQDAVNGDLLEEIPSKQNITLSVSALTSYSRLSSTGLSHRELEVAKCVLLGMSNWEIAKHLFIQECTVKKHVSAVFEKTGMSNRVEFILTFGSN